jgi:hypothetical protein
MPLEDSPISCFNNMVMVVMYIFEVEMTLCGHVERISKDYQTNNRI